MFKFLRNYLPEQVTTPVGHTRIKKQTEGDRVEYIPQAFGGYSRSASLGWRDLLLVGCRTQTEAKQIIDDYLAPQAEVVVEYIKYP
jgi:hypothetical protein